MDAPAVMTMISWSKKDNIGILLLLQDKEREHEKICVANTHLLFNPKRGDIKLVQLSALLQQMKL